VITDAPAVAPIAIAPEPAPVPPVSIPPVVPPSAAPLVRDKYLPEYELLVSMGFDDIDETYAALVAAGGDIDTCIIALS
jgi:hypothetical protein